MTRIPVDSGADPGAGRHRALRDELLGRGADGRTLAVRVELVAREGAALRLFAAAPDADAFYWEQPTVGRSIAGAIGMLANFVVMAGLLGTGEVKS